MLTRACLVLGVALLAACNDSGSRERGGELTAEWLGSDTGGISVKPVASLCDSGQTLRIVAIKGDVALGLILRPKRGRFQESKMPAFDPGLDSATRPGFAAASRWVRAKSIVAFQSDSGDAEMDTSATGLEGRFTVRLRGVNAPTDTIRITGHFGGITPGACPSDSAASPRQPG